MRLLPTRDVRQAVPRLAAVVAVLIPLVGCSADPAELSSPSAVVQSGPGAAAASSPVTELQAGLTARLVERVHVAAAATRAIAAAGGRLSTPEVDAELAALEATSTAVAEVLGATYSTAREPLLTALRRHDRLLTEHAVALATVDAARTVTAREDLLAAQDQLAQVVRRVVPQLEADEVAAGLGAEVPAQRAASYREVRVAGQQAVDTARLLAAGIAQDRGLGSPSTDAAVLRRDLTALLSEHVLLVGALARELRAPALGVASAREALRANAGALADLLQERYPAARSPFLRSWVAHLDRVERYGAARAQGRDGQAGLVRGYPGELSRLLAENVRGLPAATAAAELEPALRAQLEAVDALATGQRTGPAALRQAVAEVFPVAALLSAAIAQDLRLA